MNGINSPGFRNLNADRPNPFNNSYVHDSLTREVSQRLQWLQDARHQLDAIAGKLSCYQGEALNGPLSDLKELSYDVSNRQGSIAALLKQTRQHLAHDPDTLLYLDVTQLETSWQLLREDLLSLNPDQQRHPIGSPKKKVDLLFVNRKSEVSPISAKFEFVGSPPKRIALSPPKSGSWLREKGRTHVTKLSIPYRVFIKSRLKSRRQRGSSWDSPNGSDGSTLTGSDQQSVFSGTSEENFIENFTRETSASKVYSSLSEEDDVSSGFSDIDFEESGSTNLSCMKSAFPQSTTDLRNQLTMAQCASSSSSSGRPSPSSSPRLGTRSSPCGEIEDAVLAKRRRVEQLEYDLNAVLDSPMTPRATLRIPLKNTLGFSPRVSPGISPLDSPTPFDISFSMSGISDDLGCRSFDEQTDSNLSSLSGSPNREGSPQYSGPSAGGFGKKYKRDELWPLIRNDYKYLMDKEIIETCKSTESDLSWESDDVSGNNHKVSLAEFMQQYKEMMDWLNQIGLATQRQISSHSEKYLNQSYHEEMLEKSPRRKVFSDFARQLMRRYPSMKEEINARLTHLTTQWGLVMDAIAPLHATLDENVMRKDLQQDLADLRIWLHQVESKLTGLNIQDDWTPDDIRQRLALHQVLQQSIESHSKVVSAVLKLSKRLSSQQPLSRPESFAAVADERSNSPQNDSPQDKSCDGSVSRSQRSSVEVSPLAERDQTEADSLEQRWHAVWLQSLEWQCRLEEALAHGTKRRRSVKPEEDSGDWGTYTCTPPNKLLSLEEQHTPGYPHSASDDSDDARRQFDLDELSEHSANYDVIPFSESEYEKIVDEAGEEKVSSASQECMEARKHDQSTGSMDDGSDSALGRSVSDERDIHVKERAASTHSVTSVEASASKSSQTGFAVKLEDSARITSEAAVVGKKVDACADVGYSSESHSNEEQDAKIKEKAGPNASFAQEGNVVKRPPSMAPVSEVTSVWRNSMTSAYDTSSNCSDPDSSADGPNSALPSVDTNENLRSRSRIATQDNASAKTAQSVYRLTAIETDSEPTSSAVDAAVPIAGDLSHSEPATDDDVILSSPELPYDGQTVDDQGLMLCGSGPPTSQMNIDELLSQLNKLRQHESDLDHSRHSLDQTLETQTHNLDNAGSHALFDMEPDVPATRSHRSTSVEVQEGSDASTRGQLLTEDEVNANVANVSLTPNKNDSVSNLMQEVESFTRDPAISTVNPLASVPKTHNRKHKGKHKLSCVLDSHGQPTSCDASSEGTASDLSFSSEEFGERSSRSGTHSSRNSPFKESTPRVGQKRRGGDVASMERHSNNLPKYFASESAIHDLQEQSPSSSGKLRRTISDMSSQSRRTPESPRRHKTRRTARKSRSSVSDDSVRTSRAELSSSPLAVYGSSMSLSQSHTSTEKASMLSGDTGEDSVDSARYCPIESPPISGRVEQDEPVTARRSLPVPVPELPRSCPVADTDDTDALAHSLNSTVESFSEHAWDSYQDPPYPTASSDPGEEKLDSSKLQADWEHDLDEHFRLTGAPRPTKATRRLRTAPLNDSTRTLEESEDSDIEDFHDVIGESRKSVSFIKSTLDKFRSELVEPSEYNDPIVTCQTNVKCLQEVLDTLQAEGLDIDTDKLLQVQDLITLFKGLEKQATEQQKEAGELNNLYHDLYATQALLDDMINTTGTTQFDSIPSLETTIKHLQENRLELQSHHLEKMATLGQKVMTFCLKNQDIDLTQFRREILSTQREIEETLDKSSSRASQLQTALVSWHKFKRSREELSALLEEEDCRLDSLDEAKLAEALESSQDVCHRVNQLQTTHENLAVLDERLATLTRLALDISPVCSSKAALALQGEISLCNHDMTVTVSRCKEMLIATEAKLAAQEEANKVAAMETEVIATTEAEEKKDDGSARSKERSSRSLWKVLVYALPFPLAILMFIGLLCVIDGTADSNLDFFFTPWLKYVNGPPPT